MAVRAGRARGRFPLREAQYTRPRRAPRPLSKALSPQLIDVGLATETDTGFTATALKTRGAGQASETSTAFTPVVVTSAGTDTFTYSDGPLGAPWTAQFSSAPTVESGALWAFDGDAVYPALVAEDCAVEAVLAHTQTAGAGFGVRCRLTDTTSGATGYEAFAGLVLGQATVQILTVPDFTVIAETTGLTAGDGVKITAVGTVLTAWYRISGVWEPVCTAEDPSPTAGYIGLDLFRTDVNKQDLTEITWGPYETSAVFVSASSETDTAQPITHVKTRALTQATETDTGFTPGKAKLKAVGQAAEDDTAGPVTGGNIYRTGLGHRRRTGPTGRARGRYPHRDRAWDTTPRRRPWVAPQTAASPVLTVTLGQAAETDEALFLVAAAQTIPVGQATETETAQPVLRSRVHKTAFPYPVDQVLAGPFVVAAQTTETETAQQVTRVKTRTLGLATEPDVAQAITAIGAKIVNVNQAFETDTSLTGRPVKTRTLGQAAETSTAQATVHTKARAIGQTTETGTAQTVRPQRAKTVNQATETDTALTATEVKQRTLGLTSDAEIGLSPAKRKTRAVGQTTETDEARPVSVLGNTRVPVNPATETTTATTITGHKRQDIGLTQESQTSQTVLAYLAHQIIPVEPATDTHTAHAITVSVPEPEGRAWTYGNTDNYTYTGDRTWTYEPVTG